MSETALPVILDVLSRGSAVGAAALIVWALMTERLVPKGRLQDCEEDRDRRIGEVEGERDRAEKRVQAVEQDRMRVIQDRDRLRERYENRRRT